MEACDAPECSDEPQRRLVAFGGQAQLVDLGFWLSLGSLIGRD